VVFLRGLIVGTGGVDFGVEPAEPNSLAGDSDFGGPFTGAFFEIDADIFGGGFGSDFLPVAAVLGVRGEAEVGTAIVERIVIVMVNQEMSGRVHKHPVHTGQFGFTGADFEGCEGIEEFSVTAEEPVEGFQGIVIGRLDKRPFVLA